MGISDVGRVPLALPAVAAVCASEHALVLIPDQWVCVLCVDHSGLSERWSASSTDSSPFIVEQNKASAGVLKSFLEPGEIKVPFDWLTVVTRRLQRRAGPLVCQQQL